MARRRMFSQAIVESDAFLDMPLSSQALYFHLGMSADDDGFVNPKRIVRMLGATDDDLKILIGKRFLLIFESGVIIIKHWTINNLIRNDRYTKTMYVSELSQLGLNGNGAYTEIDNSVSVITERGNQRLTKRQPTVNPGKVRLGKVSKDNNTKVLGKPIYGNTDINEMFNYWTTKLGYEITSKRQANRNACSNLIKKHGVDKLIKLIDGVAMAQADQYAPRISDFIGLQSKLNELMLWGKQKSNSNVIKGVKL